MLEEHPPGPELHARRDAMFCLRCTYPLDQVADLRCPECGRRFDRGDPSTYRDGAPPGATERVLATACGVCALITIALAVGCLAAAILSWIAPDASAVGRITGDVARALLGMSALAVLAAGLLALPLR